MLPLWVIIPNWLLTVVIVVGNGLVIFLITTKRNLRTTTNWFVLSLAVADFGVGALNILQLFLTCWIYQSCDTENEDAKLFTIKNLFVYASVTNLCALTLDRYLAIVKPLGYVTFMTKKRVALLIFATWSIAALTFIPFKVIYFDVSGNAQEIMKKFRLCIAVLSFAACVFLSFATARILLIIRRITKQNAALNAQLNFNHRIQHRVAFKARETASAKMVGVVVTIFDICFSLYLVVATISCFYTGLSDNEPLLWMVMLLILMNSAVNPVAYAFHKTEIKRELKRLSRCYRQQVLHNNSATRGEHREQYRLRLREHRVEQQPGS